MNNSSVQVITLLIEIAADLKRTTHVSMALTIAFGTRANIVVASQAEVGWHAVEVTAPDGKVRSTDVLVGVSVPSSTKAHRDARLELKDEVVISTLVITIPHAICWRPAIAALTSAASIFAPGAHSLRANIIPL